MNQKIIIRNEADASAITDATISAFRTLKISRLTEQFLVSALCEAKALTIFLVAKLNGQIVGYSLFVYINF